MSAQRWWVYMIRTERGRLYTGVSTDVQRRFEEHRRMAATGRGPGARFFRSDAPSALVFRRLAESRAEALKLEAAIKKLRRAQKLALLEQGAD